MSSAAAQPRRSATAISVREMAATSHVVLLCGGRRCLVPPTNRIASDWKIERVGDVLLGCFVGLVVSLVMSRLWPETNEEAAGRTER
jgi:hypothetical protein